MDFSKTKFACYTGYITQSIVVNLAPLLFVIFQDSFKVSLSFIAMLALVTFIIQIGVDLAAVKFMERFSFRTIACGSQLVSAAGLILLAILPAVIKPEAGLLIAVLFYSAGSGLSEVVLTPLVEALPEDKNKKGSSLSFLHSFYSWGQALVIMITTVLLKLIGSELWYFLPLFWSLIPLWNGIRFLRVPMVEMTCHDEEHSIGGLFKTKAFPVAMLMMICAGAAEQVMAQWASLFAEKGLEVSKLTGDLLGPCFFALMMALGRTAYGLYGNRIKMKTALFFCSLLTVLCYLTAVFFDRPMISLAACGVTGLGVCIMWPGMLSLCSKKYPGGGAAMFAMLAVGGDIGCSIGPWLAGTVSDFLSGLPSTAAIAAQRGLEVQQIALKGGILTGVVFPVIMMLGVLWLGSGKGEN